VTSRAASAAVAFVALGCSIDDRMLVVGDAAGRGRDSPVAAGISILPDAAGNVLAGSNAAGIVGGWYAVSDAGTCVAKYGADRCTMVFSPPFLGVAFAPSDPATGRMCTSGLVAAVADDPSTMMPDFASVWGAEIGLNLNNGQAYDARAHEITGFAFTITTPPPGAVRVEFPTTSSQFGPAYWGGAQSDTSPLVEGRNEIRWADVGGPFYVANPPAFDETQLIGILFVVWAVMNQKTPFDYCVSDLVALTD